MKKISLIIPCYNVENFISDCLDSVLINKNDDIEVILVNDGSKDNTLTILEKYKKKYPDFFKLIDQKNQGLSMARNVGIEIATGEYLAFLDSDDSIEPNMYKTMYEKAKEKDFDIVACGVNIIYPEKTVKVSAGIEKDLLTKKEIKATMNDWYTVVWNKIYKRQLFDNLKFKKGVWFEDVEILYRMIPHINSVGVVENNFCNYMQREGSITYTYNSKLYDFIDNFNGVIEYYKKNKFYNNYKNELEYAYVRYAYATFVKRLSKSKDKKEFSKGVDYAINEVKRNFPSYRKNIFLKGFKPKNMYLKYFSKPISKIIYYLEKDKMN